MVSADRRSIFIPGKVLRDGNVNSHQHGVRYDDTSHDYRSRRCDPLGVSVGAVAVGGARQGSVVEMTMRRKLIVVMLAALSIPTALVLPTALLVSSSASAQVGGDPQPNSRYRCNVAAGRCIWLAELSAWNPAGRDRVIVARIKSGTHRSLRRRLHVLGNVRDVRDEFDLRRRWNSRWKRSKQHANVGIMWRERKWHCSVITLAIVRFAERHCPTWHSVRLLRT